MFSELRRAQTRRSFDFQWGELPQGDAMLSDTWFRDNVERLLVEELLCLEPEWFRGKRVLDAGCGLGRWTLGLLRLGCQVTAVDQSARGLDALQANMRTLLPEALAAGRLETQQADLLNLPPDLARRRFDLVYSFGVLHHTGDTRRALANVAGLVSEEGLLFLYLYGSRSLDALRWSALAGLRTLLAPFPFRAKARALRWLLPGRDTHQAFDTFSPLINDTLRHETVEGWLRSLGFAEIVRTIDYSDLYLRAHRSSSPELPDPRAAATPVLVRALPPPPAAPESVRIAMVGNGRTVHALVRGAALAARGHAVRLVTLGPVLPISGLEVRTRPLPTSLPQAVRAARSFLHDLASFQPDLLHVHYAGGKLGTLAAYSGVRPLVVTVMGGDVQPEQHLAGLARLERRATRRLLEQADLLLAKSDALRLELARFGDFGAKTEVVRWGIELARFGRDAAAGRAWRERLGLQPVERVVFSPRLLRPLYNVHLLIEAWPRVLQRVPTAVLLISEHRALPDYRARLEERARALGIASRVRFIGAIDYADMPALLSACDISVSIPSSDGLPQSLFEALASETPALLGRLEAYSEAVAEDTHALLTDIEPTALAHAIVRLLSDTQLAARLTRAGLERVREIASLPQEAARVEGFYQRVLDQPRRRTPTLARWLDAATLFVR